MENWSKFLAKDEMTYSDLVYAPTPHLLNNHVQPLNHQESLIGADPFKCADERRVAVAQLSPEQREQHFKTWTTEHVSSVHMAINVLVKYMDQHEVRSLKTYDRKGRQGSIDYQRSRFEQMRKQHERGEGNAWVESPNPQRQPKCHEDDQDDPYAADCDDFEESSSDIELDLEEEYDFTHSLPGLGIDSSDGLFNLDDLKKHDHTFDPDLSFSSTPSQSPSMPTASLSDDMIQSPPKAIVTSDSPLFLLPSSRSNTSATATATSFTRNTAFSIADLIHPTTTSISAVSSTSTASSNPDLVQSVSDVRALIKQTLHHPSTLPTNIKQLNADPHSNDSPIPPPRSNPHSRIRMKKSTRLRRAAYDRVKPNAATSKSTPTSSPTSTHQHQHSRPDHIAPLDIFSSRQDSDSDFALEKAKLEAETERERERLRLRAEALRYHARKGLARETQQSKSWQHNSQLGAMTKPDYPISATSLARTHYERFDGPIAATTKSEHCLSQDSDSDFDSDSAIEKAKIEEETERERERLRLRNQALRRQQHHREETASHDHGGHDMPTSAITFKPLDLAPNDLPPSTHTPADLEVTPSQAKQQQPHSRSYPQSHPRPYPHTLPRVPQTTRTSKRKSREDDLDEALRSPPARRKSEGYIHASWRSRFWT